MSQICSGAAVFQSTLPVWGATGRVDRQAAQLCDFNPRSPCGERLSPTKKGYRPIHFNPRSPCGERLTENEQQSAQSLFQSTLPVWGATSRFLQFSGICPHFNPRSPCGERPEGAEKFGWDGMISIHAPRVGSDEATQEDENERIHFNPRSPCGERHKSDLSLAEAKKFQSTLPVWGATKCSPR